MRWASRLLARRHAHRDRLGGPDGAALGRRHGRRVALLRGHEGSVCAAFSPDGARIVTASMDDAARLWPSVLSPPMPWPLPLFRRHFCRVS